MTAICTLFLFKLWGRVKRDVELIVGRSTIELLRYWTEECRESKATGTLLLGDDDIPVTMERVL